MNREEQIKHIQEHITNDLLDSSDWKVEINYQDEKLSTKIFHGDEMIGDGFIDNPKMIDGIFQMSPPAAALVILNESVKLSVQWLQLHLKLAIGFRDVIRSGMKELFEEMKKELEENEEIQH